MKKITTLTTLCSIIGITFTAFSGDVDSGKLILNDEVPALVTPTIDIRMRYEYGDVDTLADSNAATMRNRLGLLTRDFGGFQAFAEYEGTLSANPGDYFAPGTELPTGQTPIADARSQELNQVWVAYKAPSDLWDVKVGRQGINLDNQRWVGTVGWRQNMQTFDAVGVTLNPTDELSVYYGYVWRVNRIFGSNAFLPPFTDFKGDTHLINAKYTGLPFGTLTSYVYSMDLNNVAGSINSNDSFGLSLTGSFLADSTYYLEYAYQVAGSSSPINYEANYAHGYLSKSFGSIKATAGLEYLGSDNGRGFAFPLATLHKFNGFADVFLNTPSVGLTDAYISLGTDIAGIKVAGFYHYFGDDGFDTTIGHEFDIVASKPITEHVTVLAKGAFFQGNGSQPDVTRATVEMTVKY